MIVETKGYVVNNESFTELRLSGRSFMLIKNKGNAPDFMSCHKES